MNMQRGFFRIWLIISGVFLVAVCIFSYDTVSEEFKKSAFLVELDARHATAMIPVMRYQARGENKKDYDCDIEVSENANPFDQFDTCWYELPNFRKLYTEYNDLSDQELTDKLYHAVGIPLSPVHPWTMLLKVVTVALGIPILTFFFGRLTFWVMAGFKDKRPY